MIESGLPMIDEEIGEGSIFVNQWISAIDYSTLWFICFKRPDDCSNLDDSSDIVLLDDDSKYKYKYNPHIDSISLIFLQSRILGK